MSGTIDIAPADLAILRGVLAVWLPAQVQVWVFGSRAMGVARRYSDLDLALAGPAPLDPDVLAGLADALSESDLTIKVDLVDLSRTDPAFRRLIEPGMVRLPLDLDGADRQPERRPR
jgi:predicted nucleotidyltransferase